MERNQTTKVWLFKIVPKFSTFHTTDGSLKFILIDLNERSRPVTESLEDIMTSIRRLRRKSEAVGRAEDDTQSGVGVPAISLPGRSFVD